MNIFTTTWEKIKTFGRWCKTKTIQILFTIIGGGSIVLASTLVLAPPIIPTIDFNGETIEFPYTDNNFGENMIIYTDKETYGGWDGTDVYIAVENKSGANEVSNLQFFFGKDETFTDLKQFVEDVPYQIEVDDYKTVEYDCSYTTSTDSTESTKEELIKQTCEKEELIGSHTETKYQDEWQPILMEKYSEIDNVVLLATSQREEKTKKDFKAKDRSQISIEKDQFKYYKAHINFTHDSQEEFFIELVGDSSYGHLDPWYNASWLYRRQIDIDPSKVDDTLTNFPVMVGFSSSTITFSKLKAAGEDIRFTSSDGETLIDFEQERYASTTDGAVYWVEVPSVSSSTAATTTIYMYYGNSAASDAASSTNVWDANYKGVWHLGESSGNRVDSTDNLDLSPDEGITQGTGQIGNAVTFPATTEKDLINTFASGNALDFHNAITIESWIKPTGTDYQAFHTMETTGAGQGTAFYVNNPGIAFGIRGGSAYFKTSGVIVSGEWKHVVGTFSGDDTDAITSSNSKIYVDAVSRATSWSGSAGTDDFDLVKISSGDTKIVFSSDEFRISNIARSAAWIKATYNSGNDSLLTYGSEETPSVGPDAQLNIGDDWKVIKLIKINIGDVWKDVEGGQINIGDSWKTFY